VSFRDIFRRGPKQAPFVRVAVAMHEPEAAMLIEILNGAGIPAMQRRIGYDNPGMLAGGPREILVPARNQLEAHAILDPLPDTPDAA
jgi:hypothetical protein